MCPRRNKFDNTNSNSKRQEREVRQQEKKAREKQTHAKDDENTTALRNQLRAFNLELRNIIGDGNCLFRSFADQLDGDQHRYAYYRKQICDYMHTNREHFEPFIVDQSFEAFIRSLSKDGTYGGNECIVACARLYDAKICIHQANQPVWTVCFSESPKHEIHIFYHDHEHYSSVRKIGDRTSTSANIRQPMTTCDPTVINEKSKNQTTEDKKRSTASAMEPNELFTEHDIDYIESQLPNPMDRQLIRDTLNDNYGDIDGTVAYLLTINIPVTPLEETNPEKSDESIEKIMSITDVYDVDLVQQAYTNNNLDIDSTVESLLKLTTDDNEYISETDEDKPKAQTKNRPIPTRQVKSDKKKAKKQRAMEKHRQQILAAAGKEVSTKEKSESTTNNNNNNEQELIPPANMEFIRI